MATYIITKLAGGRAIAIPVIREFCEKNGISVANRKTVTDAQMKELAEKIAPLGITNKAGLTLNAAQILSNYVAWVFRRSDGVGENMIATTEPVEAPKPLLAESTPADDAAYGVVTKEARSAQGKKVA
jgi:hypothetical protein